MNVKIDICQFIKNFYSCICAKYYLNSFTVGKVITKIKRVNLLLRHSVVVSLKQNFKSLSFYDGIYDIAF